MVNDPPAPPKPKRVIGRVFSYAAAKRGEPHGHYIVRCSAPDLTPALSPRARAGVGRREGDRAGDGAGYLRGALAEGTKKRAKHGPEEPGEDETVSTWFGRWLDERNRRGIASVRSDRSRFKTQVEPILGPLSMAGVTRAHVEELVLSLDTRVSAAYLSHN